MLKKLYQPRVYYQKAGVMLSELVPQDGQQTDLLGFLSINQVRQADGDGGQHQQAV
jgi:DNA polymerase V